MHVFLHLFTVVRCASGGFPTPKRSIPRAPKHLADGPCGVGHEDLPLELGTTHKVPATWQGTVETSGRSWWNVALQLCWIMYSILMYSILLSVERQVSFLTMLTNILSLVTVGHGTAPLWSRWKWVTSNKSTWRQNQNRVPTDHSSFQLSKNRKEKTTW